MIFMPLIVIAHNIRSTHNIGAIFRTSEGFGVSKIYLTGYSPYPTVQNDSRLPHIRDKITNQIHKTALGAERMVPFSYQEDLCSTMQALKQQGYTVVGLEQDKASVPLHTYQRDSNIALLLGEEVHGLTPELRAQCDVLLEIPMLGKKESFNVSVATGIALYSLQILSH